MKLGFIGAGNMGCEAAIHLWKKGRSVTLIDDTLDAVCADGSTKAIFRSGNWAF